MSWKVLITATRMEKNGAKALDLLRHAGCEIVFARSAAACNDQSISVLDGCDAIIAGLDLYSAAVLRSSAAARLKIISRFGVGYDSIDVSVATEQGILIAYTPGLTDAAVADYAMALFLAMVRRVPEGHLSMREGSWLPHWGCDLSGKSLGIIGFGRIGRAVAQRARGFDLRVLAHDPSHPAGTSESGVQFISQEELLSQSDFVTLHAPLTPKTRGLIGEAQFRRMKPTAFFINTARGPLVDEAALVHALREHQIAGAALDVYVEEPLPPEHPLRTAPNLLLSPHQASSTLETGERVSLTAAQAILDLMQHRPPQFILNPEVLKSPKLRASIGN